MTRIYLGLGSNLDAERNLGLAVRELQRRFGELELSPVYRSPPLGFEGDDFLNAVAGLETDLAPDEVMRQMEEIHVIAGRRRDPQGLVSRTLDIDLLLYGQLVIDRPGLHLPRRDVLEYDFVLRPLAELAPETVHPVTRRSIAEHWREFESSEANRQAGSHLLTEVPIDFGNPDFGNMR
jgi:2-amino-4-hydroxy-6-hydroxymethyldihydropteridine diphosphokinase